MSAGRIETYLHSDSTTQNKGGAIVKVISQTDFAARTPEFIEFAKKVASRGYAAGSNNWIGLTDVFPDMEEERKQLESKLREKVAVAEIQIVKLV